MAALLEEMKTLLRVSSDKFDTEIEMLINAAIEDMIRVGIAEEYLIVDDLDPQAKMAVACYCKANFGFDNPDFQNFSESYRQIVIDMLNSYKNIADGGCND